jgi:phage terminase large subunit
LQTENKYKYSKAYFKVRDLILNNPDENVFVIRGGQGASKTISIIELIIQSLISSEKEATILSSELAKMKRTVVRDYKKVCKDWGVLQNDSDFNKSESKHEYPNGSYLDFLGADVNDVGKGFRRDILYINEADKMDIDTAVQFISRAGLTIIDYNPDSLFWGDDYINENNFITLTFEDNEYLPDSERKSILEYKSKGFFDTSLNDILLFEETNIKNKYWANKWRVYGLGLVGALEGVVFTNWKIIDNVPPEAKYIKSGVDFGYTNDPTTIIDKYLIDSIPVYDEALYRKGLVNSEIARELKSFKRVVVADSAEPKSIQEIKNYGINIKGAEKGKDSIMFGVQNIQSYEFFYVTKRSVHLIEELKKYTWAKDRSGNTLNTPIDNYNHCIDPIRYIEEDVLKPKTKVRSSGVM